MRENQPRLLVIWGKYELSFDPGEPERGHNSAPLREQEVVRLLGNPSGRAADPLLSGRAFKQVTRTI